ncbi:MAG: hypothetical protein IKA73_03505 [Alphaproteobacteria bacterium]|nr:hypothetical protein [Alphaproteobacteria bacterium]
MKKQLSLAVCAAALLGMTPAVAATNFGTRAGSSADLTSGPATRSNEKVNYSKYQTRTTTKTYEASDAGNLYYAQPSQRSALYKQYDAANSSSAKASTRTVRTTRSETVVNKLTRKYYLAHPFFQPLKGKFGSITDLSYNTNSYDLTLNQTYAVEGEYPLTGHKGAWDMSQISIKEDFSYGVTDQFAIMGMLRYDMSDYKFDWENAPDDKMDDSGLNLWGLGVQYRFVDNAKWIGMASAYFQQQKDIANNFVLDLKAGYKVARSTIYGLGRAWYVEFDGDAYGNGVTSDAATMFVAYATDADTAFYIEGGLGVFSVLNEDWTLNLEAVYGSYDWHNQASIKGAIGWQPGDNFALNLYAKTSFYDSADDKDLDLYWMEPAVGLNALTEVGTAKITDYAEMSLGVQAILYF